eukprot:COSAG06_NODE_69362_length_198_cov_17.272727_1_plen_43_part_10
MSCQDRLGTKIKAKLVGKTTATRFCFVFRAGGALLYYPMQPNG